MENENIVSVDCGDVKFESYDLQEFCSQRLEQQDLEPKQDVIEYLKNCFRTFVPIEAKDMVPPWFTEDHPLRRCHGINKVVHSGYLIRAPFDMRLANFLISSMEEKVLKGFPLEEDELPMVFKFDTPWMIKTEEPYEAVFTQPAYHFRGGLRYRIQTGLLATDKCTSYERAIKVHEEDGRELPDYLKEPFGEEINPSFSVQRHEDQEATVFKQGYPILQIHVFKK
jgi:hypothetical protein